MGNLIFDQHCRFSWKTEGQKQSSVNLQSYELYFKGVQKHLLGSFSNYELKFRKEKYFIAISSNLLCL